MSPWLPQTRSGSWITRSLNPGDLFQSHSHALKLIAASTMPPDAAALPSPPDLPPWKDARPYSVGGNMHSNGQVSRPASYQNGSLPVPLPRFPNIKDLQDQASLLSVNEDTPVSTDLLDRGELLLTHSQLDVLLRTASEAIERAKSLVEDNESDQAYIQYLRASEITINIIPHHSHYKTTITERPGWYKEFADLMTAVRRKQGTMDAIKQEIIEDNLKSNVQPTGLFASTSPGSQASVPRGRENRGPANSVRMPSPTQFQRIPDPPR